jgi:hypothetical protein
MTGVSEGLLIGSFAELITHQRRGAERNVSAK